jgi:glycosyltransferase involved in cell wall biosynthesis
MEPSSSHPDQFIHIRIILGVVMGLSMTRLLAGLARFVQHPHRERIYLVHLGWVVFLLSAVVHFWWFEFGLAHIDSWTFELYLFTICYAALFFFICSLLFPDDIEGYGGFAGYFHSKQKWFYGLLACVYAVDVIDTLWKGVDHFQALGVEYPIRQALMFVFAVAAMFVRNRRFHLIFVALALLGQIVWILRHFEFQA